MTHDQLTRVKESTLGGRLGAVRRTAIIVIVASLSITALIGIATLLIGDFGEVQSKIMLTTLVIGIYSIVLLCDLAVAGRRFEWAGYSGVLVSTVALVTCLMLVWGDFSGVGSEWIWKTFWLSLILGLSLAQANLLLLLGERKRPVVRTGLWTTITLIALLAALFWLLILTDGEVGSDAYGRLVGTVAILDVLGTIVVPVISKFLRDDRVQPDADLPVQASSGFAEAGGPAGQPGGMTVHLPAELTERVAALAAERNVAVEALIITALEELTRAKR